MTPAGEVTRERVVRAAMEAFASNGFRGTSLDGIAGAVGLSRQGLLHYFPSKVQLLLGVLELRHTENSAWMQEMFEGSHDLADALITLVRHNQDRPELVRLFLGRLFQWPEGALPEYFTEDLAPMREQGRFVVEPGHHAE